MKFPNAYKGVSKLFLAEILQLIGAVIGVVGAVMLIGSAAVASADAADGALAVAGVSAFAVIGAGILAIIAFILNLVGLAQAQKDDDGFKLAMVFTLICIALSIVQSIFNASNPNLASWLAFVVTIFELLVFEYVVIGIMSLSKQLGNQKMADFGSKIRMIISILYIVLLIIRLFGNLNANFGAVVSIIGAILQLVVYIAYLIYLANAKTMLSKS